VYIFKITKEYLKKIIELRMEKKIILEETQDTPKIILDKENGLFEISGRSLPENAIKFFAPILNWMEDYLKSPNQLTIFEFKLDYFNSASIKSIYEIIKVLEKISKNNFQVNIIWYYVNDDELIKNRGLEIKEMLDVPFDLKLY